MHDLSACYNNVLYLSNTGKEEVKQRTLRDPLRARVKH